MTSYLIKSSFPKVVVGNLLFVGVVPLQNDRSPSPADRQLLGDDKIFSPPLKNPALGGVFTMDLITN